MRCLITGCEGFIGSHLADFLVGRRVKVYGTVYGSAENIGHLAADITLLEGDLKDSTWVANAVAESQPDVVFHLAAQSFVTVSWEDPEETLRTNVLGTFYLLEAIKRSRLSPAILVVSSSAVLGPRSEAELPLKEAADFRPTSIYAVSKVAEEVLGGLYWRVHRLSVILVRPFNVTGPRKTNDACSDFARGVAEIERGRRRVLEVGNLDTVRDFTDGRDAVRALWMLAERGVPGEVYNLCSGTPRRMRDVLASLLRMTTVNVQHTVVSEKMRPYDDPIYVGDPSKLGTVGWKPQIPFEQTLRDMLDYWRQRLDATPR